MQQISNLSTSSSKEYKSKKLLRRTSIIARVLIFIIGLSIAEHFIGIALTPPIRTYKFSSQLRWQDFYKLPKDSLNLAFLGSSHAYRSYDPHIFDKALGTKSFNLGSSAQCPLEGYYALKELLNYQKPKLLVFDVYWLIFEQEKYLDSKVFIFDYLKPSMNKVDFFFNVFDPDQYFDALFLSVRYHDYWSKIFTKEKFVPDDYTGKGFVASNVTVSQYGLLVSNKLKNYKKEPYNQIQIKYFKKILDLCKEQKVKVLLVSSPLAPTTYKFVSSHNNYNSIHNYFSNIAQKYNLQYIDYNLINAKKKLVNDADFMDVDHLNYKGVKIIDNDLMKYIRSSL